MAATRHNLSRRAVLGAGVGACVAAQASPPAPLGVRPLLSASKGLSNPSPSFAAAQEGKGGLRQAQAERVVGEEKALRAWRRTLAAYRRAEARVAAFTADERALPPARRAFPACQDLEQRFGDLDSRRLLALRRLFTIPAPDIAALALKLELAVADQAWELAGSETCLEAAAADARRLASS